VSETVVTRWWWIRHAPVIGVHGRCYGQTDVDCDVSAAAAFKALAARLPDGALWLTSPLGRTRKTAGAIADELRALGRPAPSPEIEPDFIEQSFGEWQGRSYAEIGAWDVARGGHRFWLAPAASAPPGGESFVEVVGRVRGGVERRLAAHAGRDIVAVAHGGSIRAADAAALGLDPETALALSVDTLSLTRLDHLAGPGQGHSWRIGHLNLPAG
jgi:broad specificity phosphatase PhoE